MRSKQSSNSPSGAKPGEKTAAADPAAHDESPSQPSFENTIKHIDTRGLECPAPVLKAKAVLDNEGVTDLQVIVDNTAAQQNVQRFLESRGWHTTLQAQGGDLLVIGRAGPEAATRTGSSEVITCAPAEHKKILVLCATDCLGSGDDILGGRLMINFIKTLKEMGPELWRLIFVNNGVKLTIDGSAVLAELQSYAQAGLKIMVCGTCLEYFKLLERCKVGETTNMLDIVTAMQLADKVISL